MTVQELIDRLNLIEDKTANLLHPIPVKGKFVEVENAPLIGPYEVDENHPHSGWVLVMIQNTKQAFAILEGERK